MGPDQRPRPQAHAFGFERIVMPRILDDNGRDADRTVTVAQLDAVE
jgi:hypothetical protein